MQTNAAAVGDQDSVIADLGPLAWVLEELRKSLEGATKAMRRFVRDAELARGADIAELDASHLRIARQQLHQAVGALEMVRLPKCCAPWKHLPKNSFSDRNFAAMSLRPNSNVPVLH